MFKFNFYNNLTSSKVSSLANASSSEIVSIASKSESIEETQFSNVDHLQLAAREVETGGVVPPTTEPRKRRRTRVKEGAKRYAKVLKKFYDNRVKKYFYRYVFEPVRNGYHNAKNWKNKDHNKTKPPHTPASAPVQTSGT